MNLAQTLKKRTDTIEYRAIKKKFNDCGAKQQIGLSHITHYRQNNFNVTK